MDLFSGVYRGRKVLVTGHTGFKGAWLSQWLLELGAQVTGYSVDVPTQPALFDILGLSKKLKHVVGDIRDGAKLQKCFDECAPEIVFHLAAQPLVRQSYDFPVETFDVNVTGTLRVLECVRKTPSVQAAVLVTTDKCYENREWEFGYRETDRLGGKDPYSASKAAAEIAISSYFKSFLNKPSVPWIASVRAGNVIGGGDWAVDRIVPDAVRAWSAGKPLVIRSPGATRPWQHVLEPLSGYLLLGSRLLKRGEKMNGEAFNFGPGLEANQPVSRLLDEMKKTWPEGQVQVDLAGTGEKKEAGLLMLNTERAWARLGWKPVLSFAEAVEMTVQWYRQYYSGKTAGASDTSGVASAATAMTLSHIQRYGSRMSAT